MGKKVNKWSKLSLFWFLPFLDEGEEYNCLYLTNENARELSVGVHYPRG